MDQPEILYEDNHLIVVNKPAGVLVQGDQTGDVTLPDIVKEYLRVTYNKPGNVYLGVVHRLDRPVSGVVLMGKTSKATSRLSDAFRKKALEKTYWAIVEREPPMQEDFITGYLVKNKDQNKSFLHDRQVPGGKYSELHYRWVGSHEHYHLLEVKPVTGRHHQIRVMLSHIGCPIKGDLKYGSRQANEDGNICLHAHSLQFDHPVRKDPYLIKAPVPAIASWNDFSGLTRI